MRSANRSRWQVPQGGRICELYPEALRAVVESGHEIADHMWEHRVPKEPALEEDHLAKTATVVGPIPGITRWSALDHALLELT